MNLFDTCFGCGDPGVQTLTAGGAYTLIAGNKTNPATGTYRLQMLNVPPADQFSVNIGDSIRQGVPGMGAGTIETPGAEDIYSFNASPGQKVYFRSKEHSRGLEQIRWRLADDNGMEIFSTCLGCGDPGLQTLSRGGTYILTVGNPTNPATGNYSIDLGRR
jgi:hypothetical protein